MLVEASKRPPQGLVPIEASDCGSPPENPQFPTLRRFPSSEDQAGMDRCELMPCRGDVGKPKSHCGHVEVQIRCDAPPLSANMGIIHFSVPNECNPGGLPGEFARAHNGVTAGEHGSMDELNLD